MQNDMDRLMETVGARLRTYRQNEGLKQNGWGSSEEYRQLADDVHQLSKLIDDEIMQLDEANNVNIEERLAI